MSGTTRSAGATSGATAESGSAGTGMATSGAAASGAGGNGRGQRQAAAAERPLARVGLLAVRRRRPEPLRAGLATPIAEAARAALCKGARKSGKGASSLLLLPCAGTVLRHRRRHAASAN
jgi:hypothetical protein